ncbi:PREDICTED: guanine nucleotide exchange factor for Rab-3A isoform X1 [Lepidothrix coronata]|uniref:Guanine nucleotide exchange factor for Rab-3A isoform X1 n=1 Tax=Lepidothrix coronata TaxID=321398 RepID=A0A6J0I6A7_9PASS|nr:PREDICTED: guanine nucleotide exchange factor for Rab-3A isoform X1 [Lepidothrix coronata]
MTGTPRRCWDREVLPTWYPQQHSAMDTWITMSDSPAFGLGSGSEAEDGQMESKAGVCEGSEGIWLPGGKPWAMASQVSFEEESQKQPAVGHWKPLMPSKGNKEELETGCQDAGGVGETQSTEQLNVSRLRSSSVEIREKGSEFLKDELHKAQKELKLKDKECERLSKVREQLEQELEELTASLFEEAHKMVREANTKQAAAEKQLREARGKIDMLQAEVTALKTLVITSTPSSPNRELHPQLQSPSKAGFRKGHGRNKSTSSAMVSAARQNVSPEPVTRECRESGFPALLSLLLCILPGKAIHITYEPGWQALGADASSSSSRQVDSILFAEFEAWKESPTLDKSCSFLDRIYREDIGPCLDFTKQELSELVRVAVEQNTLTIEPVASQTLPVVKVAAEECGGPNGFRSQIVTKCALSGLPRTCKHRIMLGDSGNYYYISPSCRARITAVCNFFTYIRYIQQGLVRQDVELMYWEVMRLRREMSLAKLGFYPSEM